MRAGDLNRRVTIERAVTAPDGQGSQAETWQPLRAAWVKASPIAGKEGLINGTLRTQQGWRIEMRFQDVTQKDRLRAYWLVGPSVLAIQSVDDPDGRRARLVLFCETESGS